MNSAQVYICSLLLSCMLGVATLHAQVKLNEVCPLNGGVLVDEDSTNSDWIELYNAGTTTVDLQGWNLTDRFYESSRWTFPQYQLAPGAYLVVFLSGKNRVVGSLHTSYKLADGEHLYLFNSNGGLEDIFQDAHPQANHSWGCTTDGSSTHGYFDIPTPGSSNNTSTYWPGYAGTPQFILNPGFYASDISIALNNTDQQATVHYTLDGNPPTSSSPIYTMSLALQHTTVVRAVALRSGYLPSPIIAGTYFIDFKSDLPIISLSTEPALLFDTITGLYMPGPNADTTFPYLGANWWLHTEIPAHMEYYAKNGRREVNQGIGLRIHGGSVSRSQDMKSLRLLARKKYGDADIDYPLIPDKPILSYKKIVLRNSSSDFNRTMFRDGTAQQLLYQEGLDIDVLGYAPCVVFINGQYWGIHNIREKIGTSYLEENHGVDGDSVDMLKEEHTVEEGDSLDFTALYTYITSNDLSVDTSYARVANWLDIPSFCDYVIAETYMNNNDWPLNNIKYWRKRVPGGKWRYILFDLDVSLNGEPWSPVTLDWLGTILGPFGDNSRHIIMLKKLLNENDSFRTYFINRYADLLNTSFLPETVRGYIDRSKNRIANEIPRHMLRWDGDMWLWNYEIDQLVIPFADQRCQIVRDQLEQALTPGDQIELNLEVWPASGGTIKLNTIHPKEYPWAGIYYTDVPVILTAIAAPGYQFVHWEADGLPLTIRTLTSITVYVSQFSRLRAVFVPDVAPYPNLYIFPDPATAQGGTTALFELPANENATIDLIDSRGQVVDQFAYTAIFDGLQRYTIPLYGIPSGVYIVRVRFKGEAYTRRLVVLTQNQ